MKRVIAMLLVLMLTLALTVPAFASMDSELTEITERVVETLDVADDYTDFTGNFSDGLQKSWYLYWSKDGEDLSVTCTTDGLITDAYYWRSSESYDRFYGYDPAFPAISETDARRQAESWLSRLTGENERARIDDTSVPLTSDIGYSFSGRIMKNGLESPVTFTIRIDENGLSSYYRSDSYRGYIGDTPEARTNIGKPQASPLLKEAVALELYYVNHENSASLCYMPACANTVVDALSGAVVDMDALYASFGSTYYGPEEPAAAEASLTTGNGDLGRSLTETELSSIENYADALTQGQLDASLRSIGDLGLSDFTLNRCSYSMDTDGKITASLRYSCEMTADNLFGFSMDGFWQALEWGETPTVYKYISVNAKTGILERVSTSYSLWDRDEAKTTDIHTADGFIASVAPEMAAESALCTLRGYNESADCFTYARMHDGYFFPENYLYVSLNDITGTVDTYYYVWDEDMVFSASEGIITEAQALDAYTDALTVTLGYVAWPEGIDYDDPILYAYADWGCSYAESLRLAYYYSGLDKVSGVDALTGKPILQSSEGGYVYDDLDGVLQESLIETLAEAGIGFAGSSFHPDLLLTVGDAARLLLCSAGYRPDDWDEDTLRQEAVWEGFLSDADWDPGQVLTQREFVEMLLTPTRYGYAAALDGVGFDVIAAALGIVDQTLSDSVCTRADAAVLLYRFMMR